MDMDVFYVIFNAILYLVAFFHYWKKDKCPITRHRTYSIGIVLLLCYLVVSFFCVYNFLNDSGRWHLMLWPFIYLFILNIYLIKPLNSSNLIISEHPIFNEKFYKMVAWVYIILALYSVVVYAPVAIETAILGQWNDTYADAHMERNFTTAQRFANLFFHIRYLGLVLFVSFLSTYKKFNLFIILLGISSFLPILLILISTASRGGLIALIFSALALYMIFQNVISHNIKKKLFRLVLLISPIFIIYLALVTISRFDEAFHYEETDSVSSIFYYLGHSMLTFNYGLVDTISNYMEGTYMIGNPGKMITNVHFGTNFFTGVGALYLDFGPILTVIIVLIVYKLMSKVIVKNRRLDIADLFLILTYIMYVFNNVLVMGLGYGIQWLEAILVYFALKKIQKIIGTPYFANL